MPLPTTDPTTLDEFRAAIAGVLAGDVPEPMRSAALSQLAQAIEGIPWRLDVRLPAFAVADSASDAIDDSVDLLAGTAALVAAGHLKILCSHW